jgi:mRNA-degrading endonuclease RelE of RelBE toxin-antitoxin system
MTDNEKVKQIHDDPQLEKAWRKLDLNERREVLKLGGEVKERIEEVRTGQPKLFN